jgi:hypothetical protein
MYLKVGRIVLLAGMVLLSRQDLLWAELLSRNLTPSITQLRPFLLTEKSSPNVLFP